MAILSFQYRFIFIKTTKTAGTSIEVDLSQVVEEAAVVTQIFPEMAGHRARNYLGQDGQVAFFNHMTASKIRSLIGPEDFNAMVSFCVEREPVAKCISHFHMLRNSPLHNKNGTYTKDWQGYCDDGKFPIDLGKYSEIRDGRRVLLVDRVFAYEDIAKVLPQFLQGQGIADFTLKTRAKSEYARNKLVDIAEVTQAQRDQIYTAFQDCCALTGLYQT